ncbi:sugar porter family MFS transporter [Actinomadura vinacea]|uniref:Sugar porter family MFS transporter n=2 Tax=Actinomadura vinacea TaxID=115336 RepID=A0ABN3JES6_9ACTN
MFGYDTAVVNGTVDAMKSEFGIGNALVGTIVAAALFGAAVGAFSAGPIADRLGRRPLMMLAGLLFVTTSLLSGFAHTGTVLALWRFVGGLGVGIASVVGPLYIAEIAPARMRGRLASAQQMSIVLGIFAALVANAALVRAAGGADATLVSGLPAWRWMFLVAAAPSLLYVAAGLLLPESPRYLVTRDKESAAARVLERLHHITPAEAQHDVEAIRSALHKKRPAWSHLFAGPWRLKPIVWVGIAIAALQALVGIDVIFYYSTSLWAQAGFGEEMAFWLSAFTSLINVVATIVAITLIDRVGRRRLLLAGSVGMTVSLATMAVGFAQATSSGDTVAFVAPWGAITLIAANLFVASFAVTWGPVVWVLIGELFPNLMRARAASLAAAANWVAGIVVNLTFPTLRDLSLPGSYALYAAFALASIVVVATVLPETARRPLEDMNEGATKPRESS